MNRRLVVIILPLLCFTAQVCHGFIYDAGDKVIGTVKTYTVKQGDSLIEIARRYRLGYNDIVASNPDVDPFVPEKGTKLVIPTSWIVPVVPPSANIVINLSEFRLYFFFNAGGTRKLMTFPVGIGSEGNKTPVGFFRVKKKLEYPRWHVPASIRRERPELPAIVPPGENNPLGTHALRLSEWSIMIHGTNRPWAVGRRASHGCIRLYPEDMPQLFDRVAVDDGVYIIRQPVKIGVKGKRVFVEVHEDPEESEPLAQLVNLLAWNNLMDRINFGKLFQALEEKRGVPVDVGW